MVIVEDDLDIRLALAAIFREAGFRVHVYAAGIDGVEGVRKYQPQVVTVDLGLPDIDGFEVARRIRLFSNAYILMLTARTQELDTLLGLEAGADDYLTKPFRPRELRYRVEALLRRPRVRSDTANLTDSPLEPSAETTPGSGAGQEGPPGRGELLEHNGLRLSLPARTVEVDGTEIRLTPSEFDLLHALLRVGRTVQEKEDLIQVLRGGQGPGEGFGREADDQVIQVHIANLRRKLGDAAADPRWVETVHGFGYRLAASRSAVGAEET
ncbi:MAG: response regulator transcription factor [Arthrobacter sp.]